MLIAYQMMFAIITPALITGAFTNRVTFKAYLLFLVVWQIAVYYPFVHMFWGNGMLAQWGARDFAGGIVVHASAGLAALASVIYVGKRSSPTRRTTSRSSRSAPACSGSGGTASTPGASSRSTTSPRLAFLNTDIAASFAAITWLFVEWWYAKKPHFVGLLTGAVAGLATITPAAGYVPIYVSVLIGIAAGVVCYYAIQLKNADALGRRARRVGRARDRRPARHRRCSVCSPKHRDQPRRREGLVHGSRRSSSSSSPPASVARRTRSSSRT